MASNVEVPERVLLLAPIINRLIEEFETHGCTMTAHEMSRVLVDLMKAAKCCKWIWMDVEELGVHPDNREGAMLIAIDVHDLLLEIAERTLSLDVQSLSLDVQEPLCSYQHTGATVLGEFSLGVQEPLRSYQIAGAIVLGVFLLTLSLIHI